MKKIVKGVVSYNLNKNILFDKVDHGENFLILYSNTSNHKHIFQNFVKHMSNENSILFYISHKTNQLNFSFDVQKFSFNIINKDVISNLNSQLGKCFDEVEKNNKNMLLLSDWSNANLNDCEVFLPFLDNLIKRSRGLSPPGWKRKYRGISQKTPFALVNAFETSNLNGEFIQQLTGMHQRIYLLQEKLNTFFLPTISPSTETIFPKSHALPQEILEKLVKSNLELVTLLLLERNDKSGYQILKEIAQHFHCILSQGTLYPLLYQLEKENKLTKQNGKGREVIYSLSTETKKQLESRKENCLKAYQHLASFFEK